MLMPFINDRIVYRHFRENSPTIWVMERDLSSSEEEVRFLYPRDVVRWGCYSNEELAKDGYVLRPLAWKEVQPEHYTIKLLKVVASKDNAISFLFQRTDGAAPPIYMRRDVFEALMKRANVIAGAFEGEWTYQLRGYEYFLIPSWYERLPLK